MVEKLGSKLGISLEAINSTDRNYELLIDDMPLFIKLVFDKMEIEQLELHRRLLRSSMEKPTEIGMLAFSLGAAQAYDMLPEFHTQTPLTRGEINAMGNILNSHIVKKEDKKGDQRAVIDSSWFIGKLRDDSPYFAEWLVKTLKDIENEDAKENFLLGVAQTTIPFFMREEARQLEQALYR